MQTVALGHSQHVTPSDPPLTPPPSYPTPPQRQRISGQQTSAQGETKGERAAKLIRAAESLLAHLERGEQLDAAVIRTAMTAAFGISDEDGGWGWRQAYEAEEIAGLLFVRKYATALRKRTTEQRLRTLDTLQSLMATQSRRSDLSERWQQFSTPLPLGFVVAEAAKLQSNDTVLEPSAGTGLLAVMAEGAVDQLTLNELEAGRRAVLRQLFPESDISGHNGEYLNDLLPVECIPSVVLMNPPFSSSPTAAQTNPAVTGKHVWQALQRLQAGGRLVAITGANFAPISPSWREAFIRLQQIGRVVFSAPLAGRIFAKHGTRFETRLTVIDKVPAERADNISVYDPELIPDAATLLARIQEQVPERAELLMSASPVVSKQVASADQVTGASIGEVRPNPKPRKTLAPVANDQAANDQVELFAPDITSGDPLIYELRDSQAPDQQLTETLYEAYAPQTLRVPGSTPHPTPLVQSAAMASVAPPKPTYQPLLPSELVTKGVLSEAQLESIIYAGEAHGRLLPGIWRVNQHHDLTTEAEYEALDDDEDSIKEVQFRQGWFLGDGTGCGKGRQVAGIILDNRFKGRPRALWISKTEKLLEDARRDWSALGGKDTDIVPLSKFRQGETIALRDGILFLTYGTLRSGARNGKISRLDQILNWLGSDFDGPIIFDESHALANATSQKGSRGIKAASEQGRAGLRLQRALPNGRVTYVSATGATDVSNLAYAERLGLWGEGTAFRDRSAFVAKMQSGGVAAMELVSRDMKALGLYMARSLSYDGVEVDLLEHPLTEEQIEIYDTWASAYHVIHQNLEAALEATNMEFNRNARTAARSTFEGTKQRFFNHILAGMKCQTLNKSTQDDLDNGHAVIIQLVSTGEALLTRKLAEIPSEEWNDLRIDVTPRDSVMDYLVKGFPTQLFEVRTDEEGRPVSVPVTDASGNPVDNRAAVAIRDALILKLASLPAVPSAIDQIIQHFGTDQVAEVTGRQVRIVRDGDRLRVDKRSMSANISETQAFMDDRKRILIFSDAGGTGRSYHADLNAKNSRRRIHYLLEPGWRADAAIQGLGRSNRTNQAEPPVFRPVATDVKGEKRFLSTIARRLDTLGAITRGQRQTGGQGMFRAEDNLESHPARCALRVLYERIANGELEGCSLEDFEAMTGLKLVGDDGCRLDETPPISRFLNRVLALTIHVQNYLFEAFESILEQILEGMRASGMLETGVETLIADGFRILKETDVYTHPATGGITKCLKVERKDKITALNFEEIMASYSSTGRLYINSRSGKAAMQTSAPSRMDTDTGAIIPCVRLIGLSSSQTLTAAEFERSNWEPVDVETFKTVWERDRAELPEFTTSHFHMVTGLMLPIWDRLPVTDTMRIRRLQTDTGRRALGRVLDPAALAEFYQNLGLDAPEELPEDLWAALSSGKRTIPLVQNMRLRRALVMGRHRIEVEHTGGTALFETLNALGCTDEIISYTRRSFFPTSGWPINGWDVFQNIIAEFPVKAG